MSEGDGRLVGGLNVRLVHLDGAVGWDFWLAH